MYKITFGMIGKFLKMGEFWESVTGNKEKKVNLELSIHYLKNVNGASALGSIFIQSDFLVSR